MKNTIKPKTVQVASGMTVATCRSAFPSIEKNGLGVISKITQPTLVTGCGSGGAATGIFRSPPNPADAATIMMIEKSSLLRNSISQHNNAAVLFVRRIEDLLGGWFQYIMGGIEVAYSPNPVPPYRY